jgi:hypothetical protein
MTTGVIVPTKSTMEGLGYKETLDLISTNLAENRSIHSDNDIYPVVVASFIECLTYRQSRTALAGLLFLLDDGDMEPKLSQPFTSRKRREINLEFDHRGAFKTLPNITFFYEGGESKLSFNGTIH